MIRRYGFFQYKTLICKLTLQQSHQNTRHSSTLRVFSVQNTHLQTDITTKSSKHSPFFDVTGFFQYKTLICKLTLQQSHQNTRKSSTLRVFSVQNTHLQTDITTKSSKYSPFFDVTGFFQYKTLICKLTLQQSHQ